MSAFINAFEQHLDHLFRVFFLISVTISNHFYVNIAKTS